MSETADAMATLFKQGKIRAIGVSNFSPEQMNEFALVAPIHTAQPPYNLFEREIEKDVLPYCARKGIAVLAYGAICRGLLSGRMNPDTKFEGDDLRRTDPKFQSPRFGQYLEAVRLLDRFAQENYGKRVIHLALRWVLDQPGVTSALWGARHPGQLDPIGDVMGWTLDDGALREIDRIIRDTVKDPVGPEFMAPPPAPSRSPKVSARLARAMPQRGLRLLVLLDLVKPALLRTNAVLRGLSRVSREDIIERSVANFRRADAEYADRLAETLAKRGCHAAKPFWGINRMAAEKSVLTDFFEH